MSDIDNKNIEGNNIEESFLANNNQETKEDNSNDLQKILLISDMFENWFLDYASYVILDRAVPDIYDGLKPVQRRILHSMDELEDGRYNKVANIIGNTMKYHPHGDASIGDALVNMGQKELLIDCQGNWGNTLTGDSAAAPRYIEARLSKFAIDVVFNPKTTIWKYSYDGRNKEPICLPVKFPLLLAQGVEGIGVGLASKILPHNFIELVDASIAILEDKDFVLYPDFPTAGYVDVSNYNDGLRGGKIRVRAKIVQTDKKTLTITEIPYGTTTQSLIDNITKAVENGKINLRKIFDKTAENAEIVLHLAPNTSPDQTIDALYAFTNCQMSISPNACVIQNDKPIFVDVKYILRENTANTMNLLKKELEILLAELHEDWHWISLEKIFFEKRIYKELEKDQESFDEQVDAIERAFDPFRQQFKREILREDVLKLTEKPVRKISKFDIKKADEQIQNIENNIDEVSNHLAHLVDYTINYFKQIKKKYGTGKERKTEIRNFDTIVRTNVAVANQKLYMDRENGFIGTGLKKNEYLCDCSDIDEIIVFRDNGSFIVTKVSEKQFIGKNIIHADVFSRNDDRTIYNMVYSDGKNGIAYAKRFAVGGITRDKLYDLTQGKEGSNVLYFTANKNGEAEIVKITLKPKPKLKKTIFEFDFSSLAIKGRNSNGNILSKNPVKSIVLSQKGTSTLGALAIWYDKTVKRLNVEERGFLLGEFSGDDKIIAYYEDGYYRITGFDIATHFDDNLLWIEKYNANKPLTLIYKDNIKKKYLIKRTFPELSTKRVDLIDKKQKQNLKLLSLNYLPQIEIVHTDKNKKDKKTTTLVVSDFIDVMKIKAKGKNLPFDNILSLKELEPLPYTESEDINTIDQQEEEDTNNNQTPSSKNNSIWDEQEKDPGEQLSLF
ncbi:MAG: DNA gyrase/topoisomerase IV subunit A [Bacteroidales bacterium]|jgi:topoisomerase-4 subunit A|nr:DNA gyrase/topoisomerase IV subunit A [Bacteroidales bacterium]